MVMSKMWLSFLLMIASLAGNSFLYAQPLQEKQSTNTLQQALYAAKDDTAKINVLNALAYAYRNIQPDSGLLYGKQAIVLAEKINWKTGLAKAYNYTGNNYQSLSDSLGALKNYANALAIYRQTGNKDGIAWSLQNTGNVYLFLLSNYPKALPYYEQSAGLFKEVNDKKGMAASYENLAIAYESLGDYPKALQTFQQAANIDEALNDEEALAVNYGHMGIFYDDLSQPLKALDYCNKSLAIFKRTGNKTGIAHNYTSIGNIYLSLSKYEKAIDYFRQSFKMYTQLGDKSGEAKSLGNMGMAYTALSQFPEALQHNEKSYSLNKELGDKSGMASVLNNIADIYMNAPDSVVHNLGIDVKTRYAKALNILQQSLNLSKEIGDLYVEQFALESLSTVYEKQGNYPQAYNTYKVYIQVRDSILNDEKQQEITHKEIAYEYDKKEQVLKAEQDKKNVLAAAEIKRQTLIKNYTLAGVSMLIIFSAFMIASYNRRRKIKFDKQVLDVEMKALRAQMNPHFIFNSLHSISRYVMENDKENTLEYLSKFANLMRLTLENSREQEVPLEKDLHALELYMQLEALRFKNSFTYSIEIDPQLDKEDTLIPPLLLQPFVENAIIHGLQDNENGLIKISVKKEKDTMICCIIEDNGNGNKETIASNYNEERKHKSLGKKIISERLNIINQIKKVKTSVHIFDLNNKERNESGMRVELLLPLQLAF
ncbi:MAG: tetratricopeptide repeat protein [Parafilimonas sp.]